MPYPDTLEDEAPPRELSLPPNLYLIGTVNMDETTHACSPKVLDRAFTIELSDVDFLKYEIASSTAGPSLSNEQKQALLQAFTRDGRFAQIRKDDIAQVVLDRPEIRSYLHNLNLLLKADRFHFGYRVFDEICQYLFNNDQNEMLPFIDAFDQAVFMKVLPKFTGSKARLRSPLLSLLTWSIDPAVATEMRTREVAERFALYLDGKHSDAELLGREPVLPVVAGRARQMLVTLENDGFVSFG